MSTKELYNRLQKLYREKGNKIISIGGFYVNSIITFNNELHFVLDKIPLTPMYVHEVMLRLITSKYNKVEVNNPNVLNIKLLNYR